MSDGQPLATDRNLAGAEPGTRYAESATPDSLPHAVPFARAEIAGRRVVAELPRQVGLLEGEADLVAAHLADWLALVLAGSNGGLGENCVTYSCGAEPDALADDRRT